MRPESRTAVTLTILMVAFFALAGWFLLDVRGRPGERAAIPLVDPQFLETATIRKSYAEMIRLKEDLSDFDCYVCHEKGKAPPIRYDAQHNILIPKEHSNIAMGHGRHNRNNNCFNCHDEQNLELLQTRDGHELKLAESVPLCGSCHGPTYRDWEAGAHGRTGGYWSLSAGELRRQICVDCHNPHNPKIPGRNPAPGPHLLHPVAKVGIESPAMR